MILYLMRHGQTDWNAEEKVQGWNDTPLNETGAEQARAAAGKLSGEKIETIYASDFKRARKSADIISGILDLPVHYTKRLREMNFGKAEGLKKKRFGSGLSLYLSGFQRHQKPRTLRYRLPRRGNDRRSAAAFYEIYQQTV